MEIVRARIEGESIRDWNSFHDEFQRVFGFPDFYGRNMNAWIDCMTSLASPGDGMTKIHCPAGGALVLEIPDAKDLKKRRPELLEAILECAAFVNFRLLDAGESPVLIISCDA